MHSTPTKIVSWPAGAALSPSVAALKFTGRRIMAGKLHSRVIFLVSGLSFAGISAASESDSVLVHGASHWPWIAIAVVVGLLGVVSFGSRRRIYAAVGS
jgi:hypothetical protein